MFLQNDITATAGGESLFGAAKSLDDYLFFYLGARLHTRLVLRHQIYRGSASTNHDAGLLGLERRLTVRGIPSDGLWDRGAWPDLGHSLADWLEECSVSLLSSARALGQFVNVGTVVLSSYAPPDITTALCERLNASALGMRFVRGGIATSPKAVGAAGVPFSSRLMVQ